LATNLCCENAFSIQPITIVGKSVTKLLYDVKPNGRFFRGSLAAFALVLGCQGIWLLIPAFFRPTPSAFPINVQAAAGEAVDRSAANLAASVGAIRGDLWAQSALTYLDLFWKDNSGPPEVNPPNTETLERAQNAIDWALRLSPHDARVWLLQASRDAQSEGLAQRAAAALRMSYYTGANEIELIPLRLSLAVRSEAVNDEEFRQLMRHDIRVITSRAPQLKPAILAAYRDASPSGQHFIEDTLQEMDPTLLATLRSSVPH
jgi:hypothetical protein